MNSSSIERKIRARLPFARLLQARMPLSIARRLIKKGLARMRLGSDITRETASADGVPCEWIIPQGSPKDKAMLYLYDGEFVYGFTPPCLEMVALLAHSGRP